MKVQQRVALAIGRRLKDFRKRLELSQKEFAAKLGVPANYISRYESGRHIPSPMVMQKMKDTYKIDDLWLATGIDSQLIEKETGEAFKYKFPDILQEHIGIQAMMEVMDFISKKSGSTISDIKNALGLSLKEVDLIVSELLKGGFLMCVGYGLYSINPFYFFPASEKNRMALIEMMFILRRIYVVSDSAKIKKVEEFLKKNEPGLDSEITKFWGKTQIAANDREESKKEPDQKDGDD